MSNFAVGHSSTLKYSKLISFIHLHYYQVLQRYAASATKHPTIAKSRPHGLPHIANMSMNLVKQFQGRLPSPLFGNSTRLRDQTHLRRPIPVNSTPCKSMSQRLKTPEKVPCMSSKKLKNDSKPLKVNSPLSILFQKLWPLSQTRLLMV